MKDKILIKGARVHNLKNIDVEVPLGQIVGIAGVSGSGKSSLALGVIYAEGSRRYLDSLSTYTRRRMSFSAKADVDDILYVPAALALHQRPSPGNIRSTFGTGSELLNSIRLMYSRLSSHKCPKGHYLKPSLNVAAEKPLVCPECFESFYAPGAEELAFNSVGACEKCDGTGVVQTVDIASLVPDESLTIDEGAVLPWQTLMWSLMKDVAREMGVRTDVPFKDLTDEEKEIVYHGPAVKKHIFFKAKNTNQAAELDFTYYNAVYTVENALSKVKDEKGMKKVERFITQEKCPCCNGTRLSERARSPLLRSVSLDEVCKLPLSELYDWVDDIPNCVPIEMKKMAESIVESFKINARRLMDLGLTYLSLDRATTTLSNGERQRMQLARAVRNRTTGVLYILDEPSIGLHPENVNGLIEVMHDLIDDCNSIVLVDHDTQVLKVADHIIEMGPSSGKNGGEVLAQGSVSQIINNNESKIGKFLTDENNQIIRNVTPIENIFEYGSIRLVTDQIHTVKPLEITFPKGKLIAVTGVSGSGKTTLILESLIPAITASVHNKKLPKHVKEIDLNGIKQIKLIDATPIGINVRSTVATYVDIHDELRKNFSRLKLSKEKGYKAGDFSYNTGRLRCENCDGTGEIDLDIQFLPDVTIQCPNCKGSRYNKESYLIKRKNKNNSMEYSLPELMAMDINEALVACNDLEKVKSKLQILCDLGLGYLTLGEQTPSLSGGESQRLKLASELGKGQSDTVFVFDEPTIGLHPLDCQTLIKVLDNLVSTGATVIVIEHDLDLIKNSDYIIDMGPQGGNQGGEVVACGSVEDIRKSKKSITGKYL